MTSPWLLAFGRRLYSVLRPNGDVTASNMLSANQVLSLGAFLMSSSFVKIRYNLGSLTISVDCPYTAHIRNR
jgi:hypothetical protein